MKRFIPLSILFSLLMVITFNPVRISAQTVSGNPANAFVVASGTTHDGNVATFEQPIIIDGTVTGDVTSVTGTIVVRGEVKGDIVSLFGNVQFEHQAIVNGNVMAATGRVAVPDSVRTKGAVFNGNLSNSGAASILPVAGNNSLTWGARLLVAIALALLVMVIAMLLTVIWPRSLGSGAWIIQRVPRQAFILGITWSLLAFVVLSGIAVLLTFTLVGLALIPVLFLLAQVPSLIGLAVVAQALGRRLGKQNMAGMIVGCSIILLPCVILAIFNLPAAFILFYILSGIGVGGMALLRAMVLYRNSPTYEVNN